MGRGDGGTKELGEGRDKGEEDARRGKQGEEFKKRRERETGQKRKGFEKGRRRGTCMRKKGRIKERNVTKERR